MTAARRRDPRAARFTSVNAGRPLFQIKASMSVSVTRWVKYP